MSGAHAKATAMKAVLIVFDLELERGGLSRQETGHRLEAAVMRRADKSS